MFIVYLCCVYDILSYLLSNVYVVLGCFSQNIERITGSYILYCHCQGLSKISWKIVKEKQFQSSSVSFFNIFSSELNLNFFLKKSIGMIFHLMVQLVLWFDFLGSPLTRMSSRGFLFIHLENELNPCVTLPHKVGIPWDPCSNWCWCKHHHKMA